MDGRKCRTATDERVNEGVSLSQSVTKGRATGYNWWVGLDCCFCAQHVCFICLCLSVLPLTGSPQPGVEKLHEEPGSLSGLTDNTKPEDPELHLAAPQTMAECAPDGNPAKVQNPKADRKESRAEPAPGAAFRVRPADLGLIRSLSKSDSDLLASPAGEEDEGLAGRSGSVSNCRSGQPSMARMSSFASEWDEVILAPWGWVEGTGSVAQTFK